MLAAYELAIKAADDADAETELFEVELSEETVVAVLEEAFPNDPAAKRKEPRPAVPRYLPIGNYSRSQLVHVVRWIESDDLVRTEDELLFETMCELGFQRRGEKIVNTLTAAIREARR